GRSVHVLVLVHAAKDESHAGETRGRTFVTDLLNSRCNPVYLALCCKRSVGLREQGTANGTHSRKPSHPSRPRTLVHRPGTAEQAEERRAASSAEDLQRHVPRPCRGRQ